MQSGQQKMTCHENECHDKITQNLQKQIYQQKHQTQYGSRIDLEQSWTINKTEKIRIQAFENECVKKMLQICYLDFISKKNHIRWQEWIAYKEKETEFFWTNKHQTGGHNCKDVILTGLTKWSKRHRIIES